jgi:DNA repair exonuclease SbcCD ATPase subunit
MIVLNELAASTAQYREANFQLNNRNESLVNKWNELFAHCEQLLAANHEQQKVNEHLDSRNRSLVAENNRLYFDLESMKRQRNSEVSRLQGQIDSFRNQTEDLILERQKLSSSVSELRTHMYAKGMAHSPRHPDSYYVDKFRSLNGLLEQKLLDLSEDHSGRHLSEARAQTFLRYLAKLGSEGQKTHDVLTKNTSKYPFQVDDPLRDLLLRHVTALYLFHRVFKPFAAGISPEISHVFSSILEDEKERGFQPITASIAD